jgi:hypothetical protein
MDERDLERAERMLATIDKAIEAEESDKQMSADGLKRRRALLASLAAAPMILSLMNRSAWAQAASCNLVNSFVNAGYQWQSPRPANNNGQLSFSAEEYKNCRQEPPPV